VYRLRVVRPSGVTATSDADVDRSASRRRCVLDWRAVAGRSVVRIWNRRASMQTIAGVRIGAPIRRCGTLACPEWALEIIEISIR